MNLFRSGNDETVHNSTSDEYDIPQNLELLNNWTIPKVEPKLIYKIGTFEKLGFKHIVKTAESSVPLHEDEMMIRFLNKQDLFPYL